jgi:hypothetical protein
MSNTNQSALIRQGSELFNRGEYYACHEAFEEAWMDAQGSERLFLQGVIQLAVALHHLTSDNAKGAKRLLGEAAHKLRAHAQAQPWMDAAPLASAAERILQEMEPGGAKALGLAPQILLRAEADG